MQYSVCECRRGRPVRDEQCRRVRQDASKVVVNGGFGVDVERRERVVEYENARFAQHSASQGESLTLSTGQAHALFADSRIESPRQLFDELSCVESDAPVKLYYKLYCY